MKGQIRKWLMGDTVFSEYSRVCISGDVQETAWLEFDEKAVDVSHRHWLLCIEPLVFGVWLGRGEAPKGPCSLRFSDAALVKLELMHRIEEEDGLLLLLKVKHCRLFQLDQVRRWVMHYRYYSRDKMSYEKFRGFVAAYSHPRRVRLISFREDQEYNIFPMDLLGPVPESHRYVFGLRHTNRTLQRIMATGRIVVSEVPAAYADVVYKLGKHHSSSPPAIDQLPFEIKCTRNFGFYYPAWVQGYKEVRIQKTFDMGSHMLLWGQIEGEEKVSEGDDHSYLIHFLQHLHQIKKYRYPQTRTSAAAVTNHHPGP